MNFLKTKKLCRLAVAVGLLSTSHIELASAAEGEAPEARARALMAEGLKAEEAEDLLEARRAYAESFTVYPSFDVAGNLGLVEIQLRQFASAANHLAYCLRHFPTGENRELREMVQKEYDGARKYVGGVTFRVNAPGAKILVDGNEVAVAPAGHEVFVLAGHHSASVSSESGTAEVEFFVEKGGSVDVELTLEAQKSPSADSLGPKEADQPENRSEPFAAAKSKRPSLVPAYILGGVTVAALGTSVAFRAMAGKQKATADELRPNGSTDCADGSTSGSDCAKLESAIQKHDTYGAVSNVTLVVGGVAGAATVGYLIYALTQTNKETSVVAGMAWGKNGGTFVLSGRF